MAERKRELGSKRCSGADRNGENESLVVPEEGEAFVSGLLLSSALVG